VTHPGDLLSAYVDGESPAAERRMIDGHLDECASCRSELAVLVEARAAVRTLPVLDMEAPRRPGRRLLRPSVAWAFSGVAAVALALGLAFAPGEPETTFDLDTLRDQHTARVVVDPGISTVRSGP